MQLHVKEQLQGHTEVPQASLGLFLNNLLLVCRGIWGREPRHPIPWLSDLTHQLPLMSYVLPPPQIYLRKIFRVLIITGLSNALIFVYKF